MAETDKGHVNRKISVYPSVLALTAAGLFGAATPASKYLLDGLTPFQLAGLLYLGAAIGVMPFAFRGEAAGLGWPSDRASRWRLGGSILFGGVLGPVLLLLGLYAASAASVSMWLNLELVATALLGRFVFRDHLGPYGWVGVAGVVLAGMLLSFGEGAAGLWAGLLVAMGCFCWGIDNHLTALIDGITPARSTFWKGIAAGSVNLLLGFLLQSKVPSLGTLATALGVGVFSYGVSIALYISAAQQLGATRGQMFFASSPYFGVVLSWIALGEPVTVLQIIAAVLLAFSLASMFADRHEHQHAHEEMEHVHSHRHDDQHHEHQHAISVEPGTRHSHRHVHQPGIHSHPHWPDIHHRHRHDR